VTLSPHQQFISGKSHSFDTGIALKTKCLESAVIYNHFHWWIEYNAVRGKNFFDGKTWTYLTYKEIQVYLPYMSTEQIKKAIGKLVDHGLIVKGNFHKNKFCHTNWYAFADPLAQPESNKDYDGSFDPIDEVNLPDREDQTTPSEEVKRPHLHIEVKDKGEKQRKEKKVSVSLKEDRVEHGKHVKLTKEDYVDLCLKCSKKLVDTKIEEMNDYISAKNEKPYSDYAAALRNWLRKDGFLSSEWEGTTKETSPKFSGSNREFVKLVDQVLAEDGHKVFTEYSTEVIFLDDKFRLSYKENGFREQFQNSLRKRGVPEKYFLI
jgi:hypothetical protein